MNNTIIIANDAHRIDRIIESTAAALHEDWRANYIANCGDVPRIKRTTDADWIEIHGTDQVDINQPYAQLPKDWQEENYEAAKFVIDLLVKYWGENDEKLAAEVHEAWLERNEWAKGGELDVPYSQLSRCQQEKDLLHISIGRKALKESGHF